MPRKNRQKTYNPVGPVQLIEIRVDGDDVAAALAQMQDKTPQACRNAINATARKARTVMANKARKKYHIKSKVMRSENDMHFEKATLDRMEAMLRIKRAMNELIDFKTNPNKYVHTGPGERHDVSAAVEKTGMKSMHSGRYGAFVTRFKSGHVTVVQRKENKQYSNKKLREYQRKSKWTVKGGGVRERKKDSWTDSRGRTYHGDGEGHYDTHAIVTYKSPSAAAMLGKSYGEVEPEIARLLHDNIAKAIARDIARNGGTKNVTGK